MEGQLRKAATVLKPACRVLRRSGDNARIVCRSLVTLAEVYRRTGAAARAQALLDEAMAAQMEHHFRGDLADLSLPCLAKLQTDPARARAILADSKAIQVAMASRVGEARTLLLEARFSAAADQAAAMKRRVIELQGQVPALNQCRLVRKILDRWQLWAGGQRSPDETGDIFWRL
jgi:hypothetical protein